MPPVRRYGLGVRGLPDAKSVWSYLGLPHDLIVPELDVDHGVVVLSQVPSF